jgi:hypothetical protein
MQQNGAQQINLLRPVLLHPCRKEKLPPIDGRSSINSGIGARLENLVGATA